MWFVLGMAAGIVVGAAFMLVLLLVVGRGL